VQKFFNSANTAFYYVPIWAFICCCTKPVATSKPWLIALFVSAQRGDNPLHVAVRGRSKRITDFLLRNPKNARLLYTKNKAGETPYQIDATHDKGVLSQVFAARESPCCLTSELSDNCNVTDSNSHHRCNFTDTFYRKICVNPLTPTVAIWVQLYSIMCQTDWFKPSLVIFDIRALWCSKITDDGLGLSHNAL